MSFAVSFVRLAARNTSRPKVFDLRLERASGGEYFRQKKFRAKSAFYK